MVEDIRDAVDSAVMPLLRSAYAVVDLDFRVLRVSEGGVSSSDVLGVYTAVLDSAEGREKLGQVEAALQEARDIVSPFGVRVKRFDANAARALSVLGELRTDASAGDRVRLQRLREVLFALRKLYQSHAFSNAGNGARWVLAEPAALVERQERHLCELLGEPFEELPVPHLDLSPGRDPRESIYRPSAERRRRRRLAPGRGARAWSRLKGSAGTLLALAAPLLALNWLLSTVSLTWEWVPCLPRVESWGSTFEWPQEAILWYRTHVRPLAGWLVSLPSLSFTLSDGWKDVLVGTVMSFGVASKRAKWEKAEALSEPHERLGTQLRWLREASFREALRLLPRVAKLAATAASVPFDRLLILYYLPLKKLAERPIARAAKAMWRASEDAGMLPAGPYEMGYEYSQTIRAGLLWVWVFPAMFMANVFLQLTIRLVGLLC